MTTADERLAMKLNKIMADHRRLVRGEVADEIRLWLHEEYGPITAKGMTSGPIPFDVIVAKIAGEPL
jgi:hypothetical protein